jgi:DNA replicative helicase MCM subunit Mcm2 (Cdc46/Mcm family)
LLNELKQSLSIGKRFGKKKQYCTFITVVVVDDPSNRIQEIIENKTSGRVPRTIECELTAQLVDRCVPGGFNNVYTHISASLSFYH